MNAIVLLRNVAEIIDEIPPPTENATLLEIVLFHMSAEGVVGPLAMNIPPPLSARLPDTVVE